MSLNYALIENKLTADPDDCMARTQNVRSISYEEIIENMTGRGTALTDTVVTSVLKEFQYSIIDFLHEGCAINTPFMKISPSIVGVFNNTDDVFDSSRHAVRLNATLGNGIAIDPTKIKLKKEKATSTLPEINNLKNYQTLQENEVISRNGTVEIKGSDLKIYSEDPEQGIFIGNEGNEVRVTNYMMNKPSLIIFLVPQNIPGGDVFLKVRNKVINGKAIRETTFKTKLTVID